MRASELHTRPDDDRAPRREKRLMAAGERENDNAVNVPDAPPVEAAERDYTWYRLANADEPKGV